MISTRYDFIIEFCFLFINFVVKKMILTFLFVLFSSLNAADKKEENTKIGERERENLTFIVRKKVVIIENGDTVCK